VDRLLEFIKLDRYETISKNERFNLSQLINDLLIRFEPVIELKELRIEKDPSSSSSIWGDRSAITSAILNILDNAVKYTPAHGTVIVRMHSSQDVLQASIINSFEKMNQKDLDNIFNPFKRLRQSENAGSGLGLAISKKIVEKHGGDIAALNAPEGLEIRIRLPLDNTKTAT
jgi:signal transduction histidine kinase